MNRTATRALLSTMLVGLASTASADIINVTQNPAVTTPVVSYIGDADGWPTPFQAGSTVSAQTLFNSTDAIRVAEMFDLTAIDSVADEAYGSTDTFSWHAVWYDPLGTIVDNNLIEIAWTDILSWQASGQEAFTVWTDTYVTDTYGPLESGMWTVATYTEGNLSNVAAFDVPEPSSLLLMSLGLLAVGGYRVKQRKA
ncbi:PEP-CTERM sorting domain-containing protein [Neptunomonas phycophila]|uniref:PEP-CTERM sorting domain-containing protein n=1 Tax=Neptunomonas phycophila TaxID=1572645 RepID=UPI000948B834|nr:PEP-CTERM sorting domain-containing protein [Neptunomonas phycophila]